MQCPQPPSPPGARAGLGSTLLGSCAESVIKIILRVMREVLGVRAKERRHTVTPPVARACPAEAFDNSNYGVGDSGEHSERAAA